MKVIDLFAGVGGWSTGARAAGHEVVAAVEYDHIAADYYARNHGPHVICADILSVNPGDMPACDILLASPPCPNFSIAKSDGKETEHDIALARKVAEFITALRPRFVFLENVYAYRKSQSWAIVQDALTKAGYWHDLNHLNAADFAVPQTRKRMIVRAGLAPLPPLPAPLPWVGWYAAIENILHTLPESDFAPWQLARLPEDFEEIADFLAVAQGENSSYQPRNNPAPTIGASNTAGKYKAFLVGGGNTTYADALPGRGVRAPHQPSHTVTISGARGGRAFLMPGANKSSARPRFADEPSHTIGDVNRVGNRPRAWLSRGRVVSMTPHALARFQSFPDTTIWPEGKSAATRLIGNAVPPLMAQALLKDLK